MIYTKRKSFLNPKTITEQLKKGMAELKLENVLHQMKSVGYTTNRLGKIYMELVRFIVPLKKVAQSQNKAITLFIAVKG